MTLIGFTFSKHRLSTNPLSRFVTVERLVEAGTLAHDGSPLPMSVDTIVVDGKRYSTKPPNYSLLLAAEAWVLRVASGWSVASAQRFYLWALVALNQVLLYAAMLWVVRRWVRELTDDTWAQSVVLLGASFGCLAYGYAVTLNNHTPTAALLLLAGYLVYRLRHHHGDPQSGDPTSGRLGRSAIPTAAVAGLLASLATTFEMTAGAFAAVMGLLLLRWRPRLFAAYGLASLLPLVPMFWTYYHVSGSVVPFYFQKNLYEYAGSYWNNPSGWDALSEPKWKYAFHALLGHHGWLSLTPFYFFGLAGAALCVRQRGRLAAEALALGVGTLAIIGFIIIATHNYGGITTGMRWFALFGPLWMLAAAPALARISARRRLRWLVYVALAVSMAATLEVMIHSAFHYGGWPSALSGAT